MKKNKFIIILCFIIYIVSLFTLLASCDNNDNVSKCITIKEETVSLMLGENYKLDYQTFELNDADTVWISSDSSIVSIEKGIIVGQKVGCAVITAKNGDYQDTCTVTVELGNVTPVLQFENSNNVVSLVKGQSFDIVTFINYNNKKYNDLVLTVDCDEDIFDYSISNNILTVYPKEISDCTVLKLKASWNGADGTNTETLNESFYITVNEDWYFTFNDYGLKDLLLYSKSELDGKLYENSCNANFSFYLSGKKDESAQIEIKIVDENIAKIKNGKIVAVNPGKTQLFVTYNTESGNYSGCFNIEVIMPTVKYVDSKIRTFSLLDKELDFTDLKGSFRDVYGLEINGKKVEIKNGQFPLMKLEHSTIGINNFNHNDKYTLQLSVDGLSKPITLNQLANGKGFDYLEITLYMNSGYIYVLQNVKVFSKVINNVEDLVSVFGQSGVLSGYYVLGGDIDASTATLTGAKRAMDSFTGIFDGMGYTISNLDVSTGTANKGSLFGVLDANAVVRNVAIVNVTANGSSVIASHASYNASNFGGYPAPMISNVYVQVSKATTDFYGIVGGGPNYNQGHARISNVIVNYPGTITGDDNTKAKGAFIGYVNSNLTTDAMVCNDCYLISNEYITTLNNKEAYIDTDIVRYANVEAMKTANNDYSTFNYCWVVVGGEIPVWKKLSGNSSVPVDNINRAFSTADGTLDLSGINITQSEIVAVEINGSKLETPNGVFPSMVLLHSTKGSESFEHNSEYTLQLTIRGIEEPIILTKSADGKYFDALKFKIYTNDGSYLLNNVHVYNNVISTPAELESFFRQAGALGGYYVLDGDIDASTVTLTGAKRVNQTFTGIFDGMGYTISNLDISTSTANKGSLFGTMDANAVVRNVAIVNVTANGSAVIAERASYNSSIFGGYPAPMISNVYVQVSEATTDFYGIVGGGPNYNLGHIRLNNVIVNYSGNITGDDTKTAKGAFIGYTDYLTENSIVANNCYLISNEYITTLNNQEAYVDTDIVRYASVKAMKTANNDYSTFNYCWTVVDGEIPVWGGDLEDDPILPPTPSLPTEFGIGDYNINWLETVSK